MKMSGRTDRLLPQAARSGAVADKAEERCCRLSPRSRPPVERSALGKNGSCLVPLVCCVRAFTLLEVMVAVAIIAVALVTLLGSQSRSLSYATEAKFNIVAPMLASLKLAEVERGNEAIADDEGDFGEEFSGYSWKMEVEDAELELEAPVKMARPLRKIQLSVLWSGSPFSHTLTAYVRGPDADGRP